MIRVMREAMAAETIWESPLWEQFTEAAREHRRNPARLLADFMRETLEVGEDQEADEAIRQDAQRSGLDEEGAVALVRDYRRAKGQSDAASVPLRHPYTGGAHCLSE